MRVISTFGTTPSISEGDSLPNADVNVFTSKDKYRHFNDYYEHISGCSYFQNIGTMLVVFTDLLDFFSFGYNTTESTGRLESKNVNMMLKR